jgi:hypothetical protein
MAARFTTLSIGGGFPMSGHSVVANRRRSLYRRERRYRWLEEY